MKKKIYCVPQIWVIEVEASDVMNNSYGNIPVGGIAGEADIAPRRCVIDWDEDE